MAYGLSTMIHEGMRAAYERDPEAFKREAIAELLPSAVLGTAKAARGEAPFDQPQRWACRIAFEAAGWIGAQTQVNIALMLSDQLGVGSLDDAKRMLTAAREAEDADIPQLQQLVLTLARKLTRTDSQFREMLREIVFGERAALPEPSGAVVVEAAGDGHANGNGRAKRNGRHA